MGTTTVPEQNDAVPAVVLIVWEKDTAGQATMKTNVRIFKIIVFISPAV